MGLGSKRRIEMLEDKIGFIGAGVMGEALMRGVLVSKLASPKNILAYDPDSNKLSRLAKELKIALAKSNREVVNLVRAVILAVKPDIIPLVLKEIGSLLKPSQLIISIAAGVTLKEIEGRLKAEVPVIRVMPNTPCQVQEGMSAICLGRGCGEKERRLAESIFASVGKVIVVEEKLINAITGLSGSGPAYVFLMIEALSDAGVMVGLPRKIAQTLSAQTVFGSAKMVLTSGKHPAQLKDNVASPGGTTIAGIHALEKEGFRAGLINAVLAAVKRAKELEEQS